MRPARTFVALVVSALWAAPAFAATQYCFTTPTPVPDNNPAGVTVTLNVTDTEFINDLDVSLVGTHTFVGDLRFTLSKGATSVVLIDRPLNGTGGCSSNDYNVTLNDAAATSVQAMCNATPPALSGSAFPNAPLAAFNGQSVAGTWSLNIADLAGADTGPLTSWCLIANLTPKGDMNADGQSDLVFRSLTNGAQNKVWYMDGVTRTSEAAITPDAASADWKIRGVDDFDSFTTPGAGADGKQDLVFWNQLTGAVEFWLMNGVSRPGATVPLTGGPTLATNWDLSATADFNADGKPDIVWRNFTSQKIVIWTMNGTAKLGNIIPSPDQAVDFNWLIVAGADYNNDGTTDFLWYNYTSGKIVTWYMNASVVRITGQFTNPANAGDNNWKVLASADYSAAYVPGTPPTGSNDIVWRNETSGNQVVWHLDFNSTRVHGQFTNPSANTPALNWVIVGPR